MGEGQPDKKLTGKGQFYFKQSCSVPATYIKWKYIMVLFIMNLNFIGLGGGSVKLIVSDLS